MVLVEMGFLGNFRRIEGDLVDCLRAMGALALFSPHARDCPEKVRRSSSLEEDQLSRCSVVVSPQASRRRVGP